MKRILLLSAICILVSTLQAQVGINTSTPDNSAALDVSANDRGLLIPRVSLLDVHDSLNPIANPAIGLLIWNTNNAVIGGSGSGFYYHDGGQWVSLAAVSSIPSADNDSTNELQLLSLSGDTLQISKGNSVNLSPLFDEQSPGLACSEYIDTFATGNFNVWSGTTLWQSVVAGSTGELTKVDIGTRINPLEGFVEIKTGVGTGGTVLAKVSNVSYSTIGVKTVELDNPISFNKGDTFSIVVTDTVDFFYWTYVNNQYGLGQSSVGTNFDLFFRTYFYGCNHAEGIELSVDNGLFNLNLVDTIVYSDGSKQTTAPTDDQTLSFDPLGNNLSIEDGNSVSLSSLAQWDDIISTNDIQYNIGNVRIGSSLYNPANKFVVSGGNIEIASGTGQLIFKNQNSFGSAISNISTYLDSRGSFPNPSVNQTMAFNLSNGASGTNTVLTLFGDSSAEFNGNIGVGTSSNVNDRLNIGGNIRVNDNTIYLRSGTDLNHGLGWRGNGNTFNGQAPDGPTLFGYNGGILGTTRNGQNAVLFWNYQDNVGIKESNPNYNLHVNGTAGKPGGGNWTNASDARLKKDVEPYTDGLSKVLQINPVTYHYNELSGYDTEPNYIGVIAQELEIVAPYMVGNFDKDGENFLDVDNSGMTYMLVNAVQEQQEQIEGLELRLQNETQANQ